MKILIACEFSGTVRDAFIRAGHDAMIVAATCRRPRHIGSRPEQPGRTHRVVFAVAWASRPSWVGL